MDKYSCKCQLCGWGEPNPYTHTIPLEIHHIDGNYKNNNEDNLQLLCPNCHSLTETYKSHNKNGRKQRAKYSAAGCGFKSYLKLFLISQVGARQFPKLEVVGSIPTLCNL